jgi:threonyl-tRNA synthetase
LLLLEEAKRRDHRKLGKELELFKKSRSGLLWWATLRERLDSSEKSLKEKKKSRLLASSYTSHWTQKNFM